MTLDTSDAFTKVFFRKTRRGRIALIAREHYLRQDIEPNLLNLNESVQFTIPTFSFLSHFQEILEDPSVKDVIYLKTVTDQVREESHRAYLRIRGIVKDARRRTTLFSNEHFRPTFVERREEESMEDRNNRAVIKACQWIGESMKKKKNNKKAVLVSEDEKFTELAKNSLKEFDNFLVCSGSEYVKIFWKHNTVITNLYESLSLVQKNAKSQLESRSNNAKDSKDLYEEFLPDEIIEAGIKSGNLYRGSLKPVPSNSDNSFLRLDPRFSSSLRGFRDVLIPGKKWKNRTIPGDIVAVQIFPESQWESPSPSIAKKYPTGKVVGLLGRRERSYVCTVHLEKELSEEQMSKQERILVVPMDSHVPKIRIRSRQTSTFINSRILVKIDGWETDSMYPNGHYVQTLGEIGKVDTEVAAVLAENTISLIPWAPKMLEGIPPSDPPKNRWQLPEEECLKRRDLRKERIYSIDPLGSQDIDDALSVKPIKGGRFQVGVHIADVTHFLSKGSLLDVEAASRSTTVYLSDRKYEMLPSSLSEDLASLREKVDRPAVSVIWELDSKFEVVSTWYGRTAIRSVHEMYYEQAQRILDGKPTEEDRKKLPDISELKTEIELMTKIARKLRQDRLDKGALELESVEVRFGFEEKESKNPTKIIAKAQQEINAVVAEFMIFANKAVAERIYRAFPSTAILRHHPLPRTGRFDELIQLAASRGFPIDVTSNLTLAQSLSNAVLQGDSIFNKVLRSLTTAAMEEAAYISTGSYKVEDFYHYGLAADFYTHFTSPIRRYADVIVHRQLLDAVNGNQTDYNDGTVNELCDHINNRHASSKQAQRDSTELFQALYFKNHTEVQDSVIYEMRTNGFSVYVPKYGMKGTIHLRDKEGNLKFPKDCLSLNSKKYKSAMQVNDFEYEEANQQIVLKTTNGPLSVRLFDHITVRIEVKESRAHSPNIRLELVHFGNEEAEKEKQSKPNVNSVKQTQKDLEKAVRKEEEEDYRLSIQRADTDLKDYAAYSQSKGDESIYSLVSSMKKLSVESSIKNETNTSAKDTKETEGNIVRYWKIKKRPKAKYQEESFDENNDNEWVTDEEMLLKRMEIEERQREKMTVEQKYQSQIGKFSKLYKMR
eukprot:TRINITY_DN3799_c0_g1_i5.p2 TRINITY_DN3799_c0_g1~~TRINITY_DN3799_c0_g1_i5.p2  ORF type:complete len:1114 (-),score=421.54 TRINITY_DN3799_c0_g1_i5:5440-8781(-)